MKVYKMGIIGFGGMAGHHFNQCKKFESIDVKGVYDINPERGEYAKSVGLVSYSSADELINDPEIDIVLVSTTNDTHKELVIKALEADKNVICEKPATIHSKDLEEMIEVAKISSQGQVTIPAEIRRSLGLNGGDKIAFITNEAGEFVLANASLLALAKAQKAFEGAAEEAGINSEEDLLKVIKEVR
jgi:AbrB family looped-hinge helix DNA binding protein